MALRPLHFVTGDDYVNEFSDDEFAGDQPADLLEAAKMCRQSAATYLESASKYVDCIRTLKSELKDGQPVALERILKSSTRRSGSRGSVLRSC